MKHVYSEILLGDMKAVYVQEEETGGMELVLLPEDVCYEPVHKEKPYPDHLVQVKLTGDTYQQTEHLLKRDGSVLTTSMRRFWDMRQEWVQEDLAKKVIGTLNTYGFEYMKMDYNDSIGVGCDGVESLGEGLRQNMEASLPSDREYRIAEIYSDAQADVRLEENRLICRIPEDMRAVAVLVS
ncbi:MAG: hypothetical protein PUK75_12600 [bacterium]|nr:hypothetical protein [bacterium]MDY4098455.1 hypothetical protein [Lachnospiraceae bacterium]